MTLTAIRSWVGCPSLGICWLFSSSLDHSCGFWGERAQRSGATFASRSGKGTYYRHDCSRWVLTLISWLRRDGQFAPRQSHSCFPLLTLSSWEESHSAQPVSKGGQFSSTSSRARCLHKLSGILLHRKFVSSPLFIYLFIHFFSLFMYLFISELAHVY